MTISRRVLGAYGALSFPLATIGLPLSIYLAPFYAGELGVSLALLGTAMLVARFSDVVTDPLIGTISDRWRPRVGRRRVWILAGVPLLAGSVWMLFNPPPGPGVGYFLVWLALVYLAFTATMLPYHAWGGELSADYAQRTRITSARQLFGIAGLIASTLVPAWVLSRPGATSADVLHALGVLMLVGLPLCGLLLILGVPQTFAGNAAAALDVRRSARQLWRNGPFRRLNIVMLIGYAAETFRITITLFFARDVVGVANIGTVYVLYFVAGFCAVPFWLWLSGRIGKHRALAAAFVLVALTSLLLFLVQPGQTELFVALFVAKGFCFGALELLPASMFADIADVDTAMSRERRQGLVFSVSQMVNKMGQAIGQGLSLNLLALVGFNAAGGSGPEALLWLRILYCILPALVLLSAIWLLLRYPLNAGRHARLRAALDRRAATVDDSSNSFITAG